MSQSKADLGDVKLGDVAGHVDRQEVAPTPPSVERPPNEAETADRSREESFWEQDAVHLALAIWETLEEQAQGEGEQQTERPKEEEEEQLALKLEDTKPLHLLHPQSFYTTIKSAELELYELHRETQQAKAPLLPLANASWRRPRDASPPPDPPLLHPTALRPGERPCKKARRACPSRR